MKRSPCASLFVAGLVALLACVACSSSSGAPGASKQDAATADAAACKNDAGCGANESCDESTGRCVKVVSACSGMPCQDMDCCAGSTCNDDGTCS
jgi:hypothetical protein